MKRLMTLVASMICMAGLATMACAGNVDSPGAPSSGSGMPSLQQVYDYLTSGTEATIPGSSQEPTAGPGSTMKTLNEIYVDIKALFDQCTATTEDVRYGETFFSTQAGSWGVQTGVTMIVVGGTPTPTPTITPTPLPTNTPSANWYGTYGPGGTGDVVQIGSIFVASDDSGTGCNGGTDINQPDSVTWAEGLDWLERTDWRMPTSAELETICDNKDSLTSYQTTGNCRYWASEGGYMAPNVAFSTCYGLTPCQTTTNENYSLAPVRAVR